MYDGIFGTAFWEYLQMSPERFKYFLKISSDKFNNFRATAGCYIMFPKVWRGSTKFKDT